MDSCVGEGGGAGRLMHLVGPDFGPSLHFTASVDQKSEGSRNRGDGEGQNLGIFRSHLLPLPPCPQMNTSKKSPIGRGGEWGRAALSSRVPGWVMLMGAGGDLWAYWKSPCSLKSDSQYQTYGCNSDTHRFGWGKTSSLDDIRTAPEARAVYK